MKRIIDKRIKEKFLIDDLYLNGQAKICGWQATLVYMSLCRHANKDQESFPSIKLLSEELAVSRPTILKGLERLELSNVIKIEKIRSKNGKWLNNFYILQDKSVWKEIEPIKNKKGSKTNRIMGKFSNQVNDTDTDNQVHKNTPPSPQEYKTKSTTRTLRKHMEGNTFKETHTASTAGGNEINLLIGKFKDVNPSYEKLFKNKTQRSAMASMLEKHGQEKMTKLLDILPKTNLLPYAPVITTPVQLETKMGSLLIFIEKMRKAKADDKKKPFYDGQEMRKSKGRWFVIPARGGQWLEFAGAEEEIVWK